MLQPDENRKYRMPNKEPPKNEVGGHSGPPYGDIITEGFVGSASRSAGACAACRADQDDLKRGVP